MYTYVSNYWICLNLAAKNKVSASMFFSTFSRLDELDSFIGGDGLYNFR